MIIASILALRKVFKQDFNSNILWDSEKATETFILGML